MLKERVTTTIASEMPSNKSNICVAGAGAALAGVLRAGHHAAAVDQASHHGVRGEEVPQQLRGD